MLRLLLIDDEEYTRDGILHALDWAALGIGEVQCAADGQIGLQMAYGFLPDIILTDVRMPSMLGIEMARHVHALLPQCQIIFMSGYSDKEYLMEAIRLSAVAYIEKPIDLDELRAAIGRAVLRVREARRLASARVDDPAAELAGRLLGGAGQDADALARDWQAAGAPAASGRALLLRFAHPMRRPEQFLAEYVAPYPLWKIDAARGEREIAVLVSGAEEGAVRDFAEHLLQNTSGLMIGVGPEASHPARLCESHAAARAALDRRFFRPQETLFFDRPAGDVAFPREEQRQLLALIGASRQEAEALLERIVARLRDCDGGQIGEMRHAVYWLCREAFRATPQLLGNILPPEASLVEVIDSADSIDALATLLRRGIYFLAPAEGDGAGERARIARAVQRHIETHYADPGLSIKRLSEVFYLSPTYLCVLYKDATGGTIKSTITKCRLERAMFLLRTTAIRVQDVALMCGFAGGNYFSKSFRRETGVSPQEYRSRYELV